MLANSGYTVIFIGHDGTRELQDDQGNKYEQIYPRGDKRVVPVICDLVDFICYAHPQPLDEQGNVVNSTLYLVGNRAFHAGSRFTEVVPYIQQWNMEKLTKAIKDAVEAEEKKTGKKAISFAENKAVLDEAAKSVYADLSFEDLKEQCLTKASAMLEACNGDPAKYQDFLFNEIAMRDFSLSKATERQRDIVEQLMKAFTELGY